MGDIDLGRGAHCCSGVSKLDLSEAFTLRMLGVHIVLVPSDDLEECLHLFPLMVKRHNTIVKQGVDWTGDISMRSHVLPQCRMLRTTLNNTVKQ